MKIHEYKYIYGYSYLEHLINNGIDIFNDFVLYLFKVHPYYKSFTTNIWLLKDIPKSIKCPKYKFDILLENNGEYYPIFCDYYQNRNQIIRCKKFLNKPKLKGFYVTNAYNIQFTKSEIIQIFGDFFDDLDFMFYYNIYESIEKLAPSYRKLPFLSMYQTCLIRKYLYYEGTKAYIETLNKILAVAWINKFSKSVLVLVSQKNLDIFYKNIVFYDSSKDYIIIGSSIIYDTTIKITDNTVIICAQQLVNVIYPYQHLINLCIYDEVDDCTNINKKLFITSTYGVYTNIYGKRINEAAENFQLNKCSNGYVSKYARGIHINHPIGQFECNNGHELIIGTVNGDKYFMHKNLSDVAGSSIPTWKSLKMAMYPNTNIYFPKTIETFEERYCNVDLGNYVIQYVCRYECNLKVNYITLDFVLFNKIIIWVINCSACGVELLDVDGIIKVKLNKREWICNRFSAYNRIFLDLGQVIVSMLMKDCSVDKMYTHEEFHNNIEWNIIVNFQELENNDIAFYKLDCNNLKISTKICSKSFVSKYAFVNGMYIHISDYIDQNIKCYYGHMLIFVGDFFVHRYEYNTGGLRISDWHSKFCGHFPYTEIRFDIKNSQLTNRVCDILLIESNLIVEAEHSSIGLIEVQNRIYDYNIHNKSIIWVNDARDSLVIEENGEYLVQFKSKWIYKSYVNYNYIFIDLGKFIARINPLDVIDNKIIVTKVHSNTDFVDSLLNNINIWDEDDVKNKVGYKIVTNCIPTSEYNIILYNKLINFITNADGVELVTTIEVKKSITKVKKPIADLEITNQDIRRITINTSCRELKVIQDEILKSLQNKNK